MWVPLIENGEFNQAGADYFVQKNLQQLLSQSPEIDTVLLACTHYPLLLKKIQQFAPSNIQFVSQGEIVAKSLANYLERHTALANKCSQTGEIQFFTTDDSADFDKHAALFFGTPVSSQHIDLQ